MYDLIPPDLVHVLRDNTASIQGSCRPLVVSTMSSGTDISIVALKRIVSFMRKELDVDLDIQQSFAVESHPEKARWLQECMIAENGATGCCVFKDNLHMARERAPCWLHNHERAGCLIKHSNIMLAGFTCKARSPLNRNASKNRGCVQKESESTGESFKSVRSFLAQHLPDAVALENVTGLLADVPDSGKTDAEYICETLRGIGYGTVVMAVLEASEFGSPAARKRVWWIACLGEDNGRSAIIRRMLSSTVLGKGSAEPWCKFLLPVEYCELLEKSPPEEKPKHAECDFKTEHMEGYDSVGLPWPLDRTTVQFCEHLGQRELELAFFCNYVWPYDSSTGLGPDFIDVNFSFKRVLSKGKDSTNPWRKDCPGNIGSRMFGGACMLQYLTIC